jgi:putative ABC transport system permease protein
MRKKAFYKDINRTLKNNLSRFIAIVVMTALGTGVFTGFAAGCMDVFNSADHFYDKQNTYDIKIASTLGLTENDLAAVAKLEPIRSVFGNCSMDVMLTQSDGKQLLANITTLDPDGMNVPYVLEGTLPTKSGQIAVNLKFIHDTGLQIGDTITLTETAPDEDNSSIDLATTDSGEDETDSTAPSLAVTHYEITAIILSPLNISNTEGSITAVSFSSSSSDYMIYATKDSVKSELYTAIYLTLDGTTELDCYSESYQTLVEGMTTKIKETLQKERELARYNEIVDDANSKIAEAEQVLMDKITETDQKLAEAQAKINDGWKDYYEGLEEVQINNTKLTEGQETLKDAKITAKKKFRSAQKEINDGLAELNSGEEELNRQEADAVEKFTTYEQQITNSQKELDLQKSEAADQLSAVVATLPTEALEIWNSEVTKKVWEVMISDGMKAAPYLLAVKQAETPTAEQTDTYNKAMAQLQSDTQDLAVGFASGGSPLTQEQINIFSTLAVTNGTLNYSQRMLDENSMALATQKSDALKQISDARQQINDGKTKLIHGQKELDQNKVEAERQFTEKQEELKDGIKKLEDADKKLSDALVELKDGQEELNKNKTEYEDSISMARQKLNNAKEEVADIKPGKWYVWDRSENDSFTGLDNDVSFIQAITKAFPIIFFLVAILVSLTTMTRMVEEDRALIGTYKSLGYSKHQISLKYILYAMLACVAGGILGNLIGFYGLPQVIGIIMSSLYVLPTFQLSIYPFYALSGFGLFLLGIVGATMFACVEMLRKRPSELMRPKAPKEGSRILLERIPFLWKRLKFLNKVTSRNLFRYKKRAIMTIVGILGCMMLIVLGFGVRDTVGGLMSDQYDNVTVYDAIVVTDHLNTEEMNKLDKEIKASGMVKDGLQLQISSLTLWSSSDNLDITVMVIPDNADLDAYVHLKDTVNNKKRSLPKDGIVVTQNAAKQLKLKRGDIVSLQNEDNLEYQFPVAFVTTNNAGNYSYISESFYQEAFGDFAGTSLLLNLKDASKGQEWLNNFKEDNRILTVSSSQEARDTFGDVKKIINMVVYLLISMSAVLALTVLFTLSNINVSERERELATMKVLGFKHKEVYSYVNNETLILTLLGILLGMPAGYGITYAILANVSIANIAFHVRVSVAAYLTAALLTMIFTLLVNKITNKTLRKINMVEALKSVE